MALPKPSLLCPRADLFLTTKNFYLSSQLEIWDPVFKNNIIFKAKITNSTNFLGPKLKNKKVKFIASSAIVFKITLKQINEY